MEEFKLKDTDREDIEDLLKKIEKSFDIKFYEGELKHIKTFGELCDYIINKIELDNADDCTSQQSFYKIRTAISEELHIDNIRITPETLLDETFPKPGRRKKIKRIEQNLGFKISILEPPTWVTVLFVLILLFSIIGLFFNVVYGFSGIIFSVIGQIMANKTGTILNVNTLGELSEKITMEHYLKSRRNPKTINRNELEKILTDWFSKDLLLDKSELQRDTKL